MTALDLESLDVTELHPPVVLRPLEVEQVIAALHGLDVGVGGVWHATPGIWERYDTAWDGPWGTLGASQLAGTIGMAYGTPVRGDITISRVTVTPRGRELGWSAESLCNEVLSYAGMNLDTCMRSAPAI